MSIDTTNSAASELQKTLERVQAGVRDPVAMRQACERMDRAREELRKKIGIVDVAVEFIRDARNP
jgi:hypothetical protein